MGLDLYFYACGKVCGLEDNNIYKAMCVMEDAEVDTYELDECLGSKNPARALGAVLREYECNELVRSFTTYTKLVDCINQTYVNEVSYLRNSGVFHYWVVRNVLNGNDKYWDDGKFYVQLKEQDLKAIRLACDQVFRGIKKPQDVLPTYPRYDNHNSSYDGYYIDELDAIIEVIDTILSDMNWNSEVLMYHVS